MALAGAGLPAEASAGSLALGWVTLKSESPGTLGRTASQVELERSRERELAANLHRRLEQDPERWCDVLEIVSGEDPHAGRQVVGDLRKDVGAPAEPVLIRLLKESSSREARMDAATLLASRESAASFWALHAAAQQDPDAGVRFHALKELATRQGSAPASEAAAIDELVKLRARVESDPEVKTFALRLCGEGPPAPPTASPSRGFAQRTGIRLY